MTESSHSATPEGSPSVVGIVLAGGESRRMGRVNKALLEVGGRPIVERVANILSEVLNETIVITNSPQEFAFLNLPMFRDLMPGCGAFGGLYTGLAACQGRRGFLVACDMPFLSASVIRYMVGFADRADIVVPRIHGMLEPLHAIYAPSCMRHIARLLQGSHLKILDLFQCVDVLEVSEKELAMFDPNLKFVINVNRPADLKRARSLE